MNLNEIQQLEEELVFEKFNYEDALGLGQTIIEYAKENEKSVAVHIEINQVPVFTHLMEGTSAENYSWLIRKKNVVDHYNHSSYFIAQRFEDEGASHSESSLLNPGEYQAVGGSLPVKIKGSAVIGSVTVAGLTPQLDHDYAVEGVRRYLNN